MLKRSLIHLLVPALLFTACSTDLEVNAPYKEIPIVYGLLSLADTTHFLKINKAFLGEGDALLFAQIPDSSEYDPEELGSGEFGNVYVEQWNGGSLVTTHWLLDTVVDDREPGVFYSPTQRLYRFDAVLDPLHEYRFVGNIKGTPVSASTVLVRDFFPSSQVLASNPLNLMAPGGTYGFFNIRWTTSPGGRRYDAYYRFRYLEVRGNDTIPRAIERLAGSRLATSTNGNEQMEAILDGEPFFLALSNAVIQDPAITRRVFIGFDFIFRVAGEDFNTYLTLGDPISDIVEERPTFTNVDGGLGLFSSRFQKEVLGRSFSDATLNELINGQYTGSQLFCSGMPENAAGIYSCD